ncbi:MAG: DUF1778 domain-containing protein [Pirellulaceae bacterium]
MPKSHVIKVAVEPEDSTRARGEDASLLIEIDHQSWQQLDLAARGRGVSLSDYISELLRIAAEEDRLAVTDNVTISSPEDQRNFLEALEASPELTPAQRKLGAMMRSEL